MVTRIESSVTAVSWIPSEAITGPSKVPFELGVTHYDEPPPDHLDDLEDLRVTDRFREANELRAFIEVDDGRIVNAGHLGQGHIGATTVRVGPAALRFPAVHLPDIRHEPEVGESGARFVQTVGGRMGLPTPRPVPHKPFVQFWPSIAWTTLALTINADGSSSHELVGASPFPRHWVYDDEGRLVEKSGVIDFGKWFNHSYGDRTPWGEQDSPAVVAAVESALERSLSTSIMRGGAKPRIRTIAEGEALVRQGEPGTEVYPDPRRDVRRGGRRPRGRRDRSGRRRRRTRVAPRRHSDGDPSGSDARAGRGRAIGCARSRGPQLARSDSPSRDLARGGPVPVGPRVTGLERPSIVRAGVDRDVVLARPEHGPLDARRSRRSTRPAGRLGPARAREDSGAWQHRFVRGALARRRCVTDDAGTDRGGRTAGGPRRDAP